MISVDKEEFKKQIEQYYQDHKRLFAWRETKNPYHILVSEIMLQQTQTSRVIPKYEAFLKQFPTTKKLAEASLSDVLIAWQGLGYNRRPKALKKAAEIIMKDHSGKFPEDYETLLSLPGIGQSTAGAVMAFAFGKPIPFIETNIRTVFLHFFFNDKDNVKDTEIMGLIAETIDHDDPRQWFYALYDYGAMLKSSGKGLNPKSAHYKKQSAFKGSNREIRSKMLKFFLREKFTDESTIKKSLDLSEEILKKNLTAFEKEGLIIKDEKNRKWHIAS